jgi:hypothetical protein
MTTKGSSGKPSDGTAWFSILFFGLAVDIGAVSFLVLEISIRVLRKSTSKVFTHKEAQKAQTGSADFFCFFVAKIGLFKNSGGGEGANR